MNFSSRVSSLVLALIGFCVSASSAEEGFYIEGYTGQVSIAQGEEVAFHVATSAPKFSMEITRAGAKPETVLAKKDIPGSGQPIPEDASANGCHWSETLRIKVPESWSSGYYTAKFRIEDNGGAWSHRSKRTAESTAWFVVRPAHPGAKSKVLIQLCTNTYAAYNNWGGFSLYAYHGLSKNQGHRVSFDRPTASQFTRWEEPFVIWAEKNGITLEYAANSDLEFHPEILKHYKLVLSVGHDEYWSAPMRDSLEAYIAGGGNVAFFSGNSVCWQVRSEDEGRALTCWKQNYHSDPVYQTRDYKTLGTAWSHHLVNRPENQLTGVGFLWGGYRHSHGQFIGEPAEYTVHQPSHWVFEGTNLQRGATFGAHDSIVGYEADGCELEWRQGLPYSTHRDGTPTTFTVLGTCPVRWHPDDAEWYERWEKGRTGAACMGIYTQGGTVFTAATTDWARGLRGDDKVVERITKNVLDRLGQ
ncbi:MAG: hypothetical protein JWO89_691 [Verrucomicrobiaceae bacterium]|nr:hypothetical protein [Verrucomicrobiaceae bacterium]